jgi:hypothetical protein
MSNKTSEKYDKQIVHDRELKYVKLSKMKVSAMAQRQFNPSWANQLFKEFDIDRMATPQVSFREGYYYIMDGQHTIAALKQFLGKGWEDQCIQCWVATGLTEQDEADIFLSLQYRKNVDAFQKFRVSLTAARPIETEINKIVHNERLVISQDTTLKGSLACVGTLIKTFKRDGPESLQRTLSIIRDAYGDGGFKHAVIDGISMVCHRYNGVLNPESTIESLRHTNGGVNGLLNKAYAYQTKTGHPMNICVAAEVIIIINRDRTPKTKLPSWFKE